MSTNDGAAADAENSPKISPAIEFAATGLQFGRAKILPGTMGSLWGVAISAGLHYAHANLAAQLATIVLGLIIGWLVSHRYIQQSGAHDPSEVVIDEYTAFPIAMLFVPFSWTRLWLVFLLFRIFDISKVWPVNQLEKLPGPTGVMADDIAAAVMAGAVLYGGEVLYLAWAVS